MTPLARKIRSIDKTIEFVEDLINLQSKSGKQNTSSSDKESFGNESQPTSPRTLDHDDPTNNIDDLNPPSPPPDAIDPMMCPRGLPIVVSHYLQEIQMPTNLPKVFGSPHEDPMAHMERFEEMLVFSLVTNPGHYLIWFLNTLMDLAYSWYQSHTPRTFTTWDQLQIMFLRWFCPET